MHQLLTHIHCRYLLLAFKHKMLILHEYGKLEALANQNSLPKLITNQEIDFQAPKKSTRWEKHHSIIFSSRYSSLCCWKIKNFESAIFHQLGMCFVIIHLSNQKLHKGGSRIFFRMGCTCLLLYFNTNKPHSFFFWQNTSGIRKPQAISGGCAPPAPSPQIRPCCITMFVPV